MKPLKKLLVRAALAALAGLPLLTLAQATTPPLPAIVKAATQGQTAVVTAMLEKGADPDARLADGRTALMEASIRGDYDTVRTLVSHGARKALKDVSGRTAFDFAYERKHTDIAALLRGLS